MGAAKTAARGVHRFHEGDRDLLAVLTTLPCDPGAREGCGLKGLLRQEGARLEGTVEPRLIHEPCAAQHGVQYLEGSLWGGGGLAAAVSAEDKVSGAERLRLG